MKQSTKSLLIGLMLGWAFGMNAGGEGEKVVNDLNHLLANCNYSALRELLRTEFTGNNLFAVKWAKRPPQRYDLCVINAFDYRYFHQYNKSMQKNSPVMFTDKDLSNVLKNTLLEYIRAIQEDYCVCQVFGKHEAYKELVKRSSLAPLKFALKECCRWYPVYTAFKEKHNSEKGTQTLAWQKIEAYTAFVTSVIEELEGFHQMLTKKWTDGIMTYPGIPLVTALIEFKHAGSWELLFSDPKTLPEALQYCNVHTLIKCHDWRLQALESAKNELLGYKSWDDFFIAINKAGLDEKIMSWSLIKEIEQPKNGDAVEKIAGSIAANPLAVQTSMLAAMSVSDKSASQQITTQEKKLHQSLKASTDQAAEFMVDTFNH